MSAEMLSYEQVAADLLRYVEQDRANPVLLRVKLECLTRTARLVGDEFPHERHADLLRRVQDVL